MEETPMDVALFRKGKSGIVYEQLVEEINFFNTLKYKAEEEEEEDEEDS